MSLKEQISAHMKEALKNKETDRLSALRFLQAALKNREIELRPQSMTDEDAMGVIIRLIKQRKESIEQYQAAGRQDLVESETKELQLLQTYLPQQLSQQEVESIVNQAIAEVGAQSIKQMGLVMKAVMAKTAGRADNKMISELIKSKLGG